MFLFQVRPFSFLKRVVLERTSLSPLVNLCSLLLETACKSVCCSGMEQKIFFLTVPALKKYPQILLATSISQSPPTLLHEGKHNLLGLLVSILGEVTVLYFSSGAEHNFKIFILLSRFLSSVPC